MTPCPFLPQPERVLSHRDVLELGADRSAIFYQTAMSYAQTLWLEGFPAKALLLINRALSCFLPGVPLDDDAKPYHAIAWILQNRPPDKFIGNPRRHYQHLATRMTEPHKELRVWRAWACWYLAREILPDSEHPPDLEQVRKKGIIKPRRAEIAEQLARLSPSDDLPAWESALRWAGVSMPGTGNIQILPLSVAEVEEVRRLAHVIWHAVYPAIISRAQIDHMLAQRYAPETLREDIRTRGVHYAFIRDDAQNIGYLAWEPIRAEGTAFLHKLYVLPQHHGRGAGAEALRWVEESARAAGLNRIRLRVNRRNYKAIRAYVRAGFAFESEVITDIGEGFVMDDYVLMRVLTPA